MVLSFEMSRWAHDTSDVELPNLEVHPHFLRSADDEITVGQDFGDNRRHRNLDLFGAVDRALAVGGALRRIGELASELWRGRVQAEPELIADLGVKRTVRICCPMWLCR